MKKIILTCLLLVISQQGMIVSAEEKSDQNEVNAFFDFSLYSFITISL
ncbi:hypothetical protein [Spartinivicinus ruber]|nr:hypothetical protein [Spartinivicinus ruber]